MGIQVSLSILLILQIESLLITTLSDLSKKVRQANKDTTPYLCCSPFGWCVHRGSYFDASESSSITEVIFHM